MLKGDKIENLKRVKRAVKLAVYAAHHLMLERSFIETQRKMFKDGFAINDSLPPDESDEYLDIDFHGSWEDIHISTEEDGQTCSCRGAYFNFNTWFKNWCQFYKLKVT